ncbi:MAG: hypothetical protein HC923_02795 [Myxococcales bacterium]|nr:hypothetical protein [Myxococcales bacterium]
MGFAILAIWVARPARADTENFELNGKIYTKYLYKNDATRGCLSLSNPFWPDNIGGGNGICSEFELNILGRVSKYVTAGIRIKSRFGALWQGWWENGDTRWDFPQDTLFREDTSGESLGLNHAQYMKLRGAYIRANLPLPTVRFVHIGSSDFSMFNEWTIGKSRYIDRDNGNGVFIDGAFDDRLRYHLGFIALPKLFVGPRWTTGLKDADPLAGFWGADWAYGLKLEADPTDDLSIRTIVTYIHDWEADRNDPDLTGPSDADRGTDRSVDWTERFQGLNSTIDLRFTPSWADYLSLTALGAFAANRPNFDTATNAVQNDQGFSPVLYLQDAEGNSIWAWSFAGKALLEVFDPFDIGLSLKAEYFNIGEHFNAVFGARREADVLLTDGFIGRGFIDGGQLPTLNLANEFIDFDEPWYEAIIGWHGVTGVLEFVQGGLNSTFEATYIDYNTDQQNRDVDNQYPDFLYTDGFLDPLAFTADFDYANVFDRGADARSVYAEFQERESYLFVLKAEYLIPNLPFVERLVARTKFKWIHDTDDRNLENDRDDYVGNLWLGFAFLDFQWSDSLSTGLGYEFQYWDEDNRSGTQQTDFFEFDTFIHVAGDRRLYVWRSDLSVPDRTFCEGPGALRGASERRHRRRRSDRPAMASLASESHRRGGFLTGDEMKKLRKLGFAIAALSLAGCGIEGFFAEAADTDHELQVSTLRGTVANDPTEVQFIAADGTALETLDATVGGGQFEIVLEATSDLRNGRLVAFAGANRVERIVPELTKGGTLGDLAIDASSTAATLAIRGLLSLQQESFQSFDTASLIAALDKVQTSTLTPVLAGYVQSMLDAADRAQADPAVFVVPVLAFDASQENVLTETSAIQPHLVGRRLGAVLHGRAVLMRCSASSPAASARSVGARTPTTSASSSRWTSMMGATTVRVVL